MRLAAKKSVRWSPLFRPEPPVTNSGLQMDKEASSNFSRIVAGPHRSPIVAKLPDSEAQELGRNLEYAPKFVLRHFRRSSRQFIKTQKS